MGQFLEQYDKRVKIEEKQKIKARIPTHPFLSQPAIVVECKTPARRLEFYENPKTEAPVKPDIAEQYVVTMKNPTLFPDTKRPNEGVMVIYRFKEQEVWQGYGVNGIGGLPKEDHVLDTGEFVRDDTPQEVYETMAQLLRW